MKKLMFAIAAVAAGTVLADVTSANVVGYHGVESLTVDYRLIAPSFLGVGDENGQFSLKDLRGAGYTPSWFDDLDNMCWIDGCAEGQLRINTLNQNGIFERTFDWVDYKEGDDEANPDVHGPYWAEVIGDDHVPLTDVETAAIKFDLGDALWVSGDGNCFQLQSAGQVTKKEVVVPSLEVDYCMAGNATAHDLTLAQIYGTGYKPSWFDDIDNMCWIDGCAEGQVRLNTLDPNGIFLRTFDWIDYKEGDDEANPDVYGPYWAEVIGDDHVPLSQQEMEAIEVKAGDAFRLSGDGSCYAVGFPAVEGL